MSKNFATLFVALTLPSADQFKKKTFTSKIHQYTSSKELIDWVKVNVSLDTK